MTSMDEEQELPALPLPTWFGGEPIPGVDPDLHPHTAWGMFEVIEEDGSLNWLERTTPGYDAEALLAQLSGYLGDIERTDRWTPAFPEPLDVMENDEAEESGLDERFESLTFYGLRPDDRLTGRYVFMVIGQRADGDHESEVDLRSPGLAGPELEGILRLAQMRFIESLSWGDVGALPAEQVDDDFPVDNSTLGDMLEGWGVPRLPADVTFGFAWAALELEDEDGLTTWVERLAGDFDSARLASALLLSIDRLQSLLMSEWDAPDDRPRGTSLPDDEDDEDAGSEASPINHDGPLPVALAQLGCRAVPAGWRIRRGMIYAPGLDREGHSRLYRAYSAAPESGVPAPYVNDYEELGLLRSALRSLLD